MADLRGFDAETVEPNDSFDPISNGDYLCIITMSEMKPTAVGGLKARQHFLNGRHP